MKIRQGFVSNSSSSSFAILGKLIKDWREIDAKLISDGKIIVEGDCISDGMDVFKLTTEMYKTMSMAIVGDLSFYEIYATSKDNYILKNTLPDQFNIFNFEVDQNSTHSVEKFKERYISYIE